MTDTWTDTAGRTWRPSLEQQKREVKALLARDFCANLMNNTKWRELLAGLDRINADYWVKFVDVAAPMAGHLEHRTDDFHDSTWGPLPILSVEWIEVRPYQEAILALVKHLRVPFDRTTHGIRVTAHVRNGAPMPAGRSLQPSPLHGSD